MTKVILAGAGPGDAELITLKLYKALQTADVILTDRLVNEEIISLYANPKAIVVEVGKEGFNKHSYSQAEVNEILLHYALKKNINIVRLKGGDVAFYSNVLDELLLLHHHQIPFEIIPGITAASGASAYAGIPLTARGYARSVRFITCEKNETSVTYWKALADTNDTLVLYMGVKNIVQFMQNLQPFCKQDKAVAIIEQATTCYQKTYTTTVDEIANGIFSKQVQTPALVLIGSVVNLHQSFAWFNTKAEGNIFQSKLEAAC